MTPGGGTRRRAIQCFNPCFDGSVARGSDSHAYARPRKQGFNPCFDGSVARGSGRRNPKANETCFNPCFDGSVARGPGVESIILILRCVSILVLMEV